MVFGDKNPRIRVNTGVLQQNLQKFLLAEIGETGEPLPVPLDNFKKHLYRAYPKGVLPI